MKKKQYLHFGNLLVLSMLLLFTGCEQKEQTVEESSVSTEEISVEETPLPVEMTKNQLFYAEGMESISITERELTAGKEVDMTVQTAEGEDIYCELGREQTNPQMKLIVVVESQNKIQGIDLISDVGEEFFMKDFVIPRKGYKYQMAWYDFNQDGKKELIFAGGYNQEIFVCDVFQFESIADDVLAGKWPQKILEIREGVRAYVNDDNEICVVDAENHISKQTVNCQE